MMLVPVMLVISAIVCGAVAIFEIAVVCMLWSGRKSYTDHLEGANGCLVVRIPSDRRLTDYRGITRRSERIDEAISEMVVDETGEAGVIVL